MKLTSTIITAVLALALQGAFVDAQANSTSGHCTGMTVTDYVSSDSNTAKNSISWQNVTDGHLNFTTSSTGCVVITFVATAGVTPSNDGSFGYLYVRTLLDGNNLCMPATYNEIIHSGQYPGNASADSITHICRNVAAGVHTVQVQYKTNDVIGLIDAPVLTVTHN